MIAELGWPTTDSSDRLGFSTSVKSTTSLKSPVQPVKINRAVNFIIIFFMFVFLELKFEGGHVYPGVGFRTVGKAPTGKPVLGTYARTRCFGVKVPCGPIEGVGDGKPKSDVAERVQYIPKGIGGPQIPYFEKITVEDHKVDVIEGGGLSVKFIRDAGAVHPIEDSQQETQVHDLAPELIISGSKEIKVSPSVVQTEGTKIRGKGFPQKAVGLKGVAPVILKHCLCGPEVPQALSFLHPGTGNGESTDHKWGGATGAFDQVIIGVVGGTEPQLMFFGLDQPGVQREFPTCV